MNTESYTIAKITLIGDTKQTEKFNMAFDVKGRQEEIESKMEKNTARSALNPLSIGYKSRKIGLLFCSSIFFILNNESSDDVTEWEEYFD